MAAGRIGAVCESLGVLTLDTEIPVQEINSRKLVSLRLPQEVRLVDFTDRKAAQNGKILTTEMSGAAASYSAFQSLAASIDASGNDGIRSRLRFSGPEQEVGYFIFGDAGPRDWPDGQEQSIAEVVTALGYQLVDDESLPRSEVSFNE
ncbi:hypothetical protein AUR04nite_07240 [Glutamicibacter uratoxydans]|uniref:RES domain-containing protein n=1 Tax=Glutamicibacter uratoxydans TaxID=43667 RepID=A0A4Y4DIV9_GLUUR|nr:hypothetical protein AUR04nite_07240 [Glutamicibacter uratoxydans]